MKNKIFLLLILISIVCTAMAYAYPVQYQVNSASNFSNTVYHCTNSACNSLSDFVSSDYGNPIYFNITNLGAGWQYFAQYAFQSCMIPHTGSIFVDEYTLNGPYTKTITFTKSNNCSSEITQFTLSSNNINLSQMITINAKVKSALTFRPDVLTVPTSLRNEYSTNTTVILKSNGVEKQRQNVNVVINETADVSFSYTPTQAGVESMQIITIFDDECKCTNWIEKQSPTLILNTTNQTTPPTPIPTTTSVVVNPVSPITYGALSNFSCSNSQGQPTNLTINGINKNSEKGLNILRAAGAYTINCSFAGNSNYGASSQQISYIINKLSSPGFNLNLNAIPSWIVNNGTQTTVTGTGCPSQLTCTLTRNSGSASNPDIATLAIGIYNYNYSTSGNENYTSASVSNILNVTLSSIPPVNDTTPPIITIISPLNQTYPDNNINFSVIINEPGYCSLELDNQTYSMLNSSAVDWFMDYLHNLVILNGCHHKVKYTCSDIAGNTAQTGYVYFSINFSGCFNQTNNDTDDNCDTSVGTSTKRKLSISLPLLSLKPVNNIAHFRVIIENDGSRNENGLIILQIQDFNFKRTMEFSVLKNNEESVLFDIPITKNIGKVKAKITLEYAGKSEDYYYNLNVDSNGQTASTTSDGDTAATSGNSGSTIGITGNVIKSGTSGNQKYSIAILLLLIAICLVLVLIARKRG